MLGEAQRIFLPQMVYEEIVRTEDDLAKWLKASKIPIQKIDESVTICLKRIYDFDPSHKFLVDNTKQRSLADPWIIAHALSSGACVVTKEEKLLASNSTRIRIPNVCDNMKIKWLNDFQLIEELSIQFFCSVPQHLIKLENTHDNSPAKHKGLFD